MHYYWTASHACPQCVADVSVLILRQAWNNTPRIKGGLGGIRYPLLSDLTKSIARDYDVLIEDGPDAGVALR